MCTALQGLASPIKARGGAAKPAYVHNGLPFDPDGALAIEDMPVDHFSQGLPMTANGRIAASTNGDVLHIANAATPFTATGVLAIAGLASAITHYANGVAFTGGNKVACELLSPFSPTPPTNVLTTDSGDPLTTDNGDYITAG